MAYVKRSETCARAHCRKLAEPGSDLCGVHRIDEQLARERAMPPQPKIYEWVLSCMFCSFQQHPREPMRWTRKQARRWVRSGWLRCPVCRAHGIELSELEYGVQRQGPMRAHEGNHPERTSEWSMAS